MSSFHDEMDAEALAQLRFDWDTAYTVDRTGPVTWLAARLDGKGVLHANTADDLREAIKADYEAAPVPRDVAGP